MKRYDLRRRDAEETGILDASVGLAEMGEGRRVVKLHVDEDVASLAPYLDALDAVILDFPTFRDGRAFTQARTLREALKFRGQVLANGSPLPDQANFLQRCGFDSVLLPEEQDVRAWATHETHFPLSYQDNIFSS